jgi:signal transduction histidine kinase
VALLSRYTESDQQSSRDKHLAKIKTAVNHLTGILNDFLSISKFDEGKIRPNPEMLHLDEFVKEIYEEMKALLKPGQVINLNNRTSGLTLFNDPKIIKNIFLNLLSNAIKYSKEGSEIFWSVEAQDGKLYFEVRDQGIGIPEEDQKYLFDRFFRASNATNIEGTGLGLNIVKKYLELLGGHITFKSIYGTGTTFNVEIPMNLNITENES